MWRIPNSNTVSVIDTATNAVAATIRVGKAPVAVAVCPDGTRVYVANQNDHTLSVIDTAANKAVATIPAGRFPVGVGGHAGRSPRLCREFQHREPNGLRH